MSEAYGNCTECGAIVSRDKKCECYAEPAADPLDMLPIRRMLKRASDVLSEGLAPPPGHEPERREDLARYQDGHWRAEAVRLREALEYQLVALRKLRDGSMFTPESEIAAAEKRIREALEGK